MKINIQKTKNRLISMLGAVCVFVFFMAVPAFAANGNEFINFNDYATYQTSEDGTMVYVDADLPLNSALVYYTGVVYTPDPVNGRFHIPVSTLSQDLRFNPLGGYGTGAFPDVGEQERAVNFIDITYIPANAILTFGCQIELSSEVINRDFIPSDLHYAFVDSDGVVVSSYYDSYEFSWYQNKVTAKYVLDLTYTLDLSTVNLPSNAVGLYFQYWFYDYFVDEGTLIAEFQHFKMQFPYSAIQQEAINNQKLQQSLNKIDKAIERQNQILQDQNDKLDDMISGTPEQDKIVDGAVDKMNQAGDKLGELGDSMSSIEKPDTSNIKVGITDLVPETSLLAYTAPILQIWNNDTLVAMLVIVVTLVLVSWIFFGKKG